MRPRDGPGLIAPRPEFLHQGTAMTRTLSWSPLLVVIISTGSVAADSGKVWDPRDPVSLAAGSAPVRAAIGLKEEQAARAEKIRDQLRRSELTEAEARDRLSAVLTADQARHLTRI